MADVVSSRVKMNDQEIGDEKNLGEVYQNKRASNLNAMIDLKNEVHSAIYSSPGSFSFTVPELVTRIYVTGAGGGGGGRGSSAALYNHAGGSGGEVYSIAMLVTPGATLNGFIGSGGIGGIGLITGQLETFGSNGTATTFNGFTWVGGTAENNLSPIDQQSVTAVREGGFAGNGGSSTTSDTNAFDGESTIYAAGGAGGVEAFLQGGAGSGGGASYGAGGSGGNFTGGPGAGANGVFGGGGGGAGYPGASQNAGNGGNGIIIIRW